MKTTPTYEAQIFCGLQEGYTGLVHDVADAKAICKAFVDTVGLCVTFTETTFIYTETEDTPKGHEPGFGVGLIDYPRFPSTPDEIKAKAIELAGLLKEAFKQHRVSVVCTDETILLGGKE
jgi:hypothetical protein